MISANTWDLTDAETKLEVSSYCLDRYSIACPRTGNIDLLSIEELVGHIRLRLYMMADSSAGLGSPPRVVGGPTGSRKQGDSNTGQSREL